MFRIAFRSLVRQPSFTLAACGTLAMGVAAATTLFATVNEALLRPLPYPRSQDIHTIRTYFPSGRFTIGLVGTEEMAAVAELQDAVAAVAVARRFDLALRTDAVARQVTAYGVSEGFFPLFQVPVAMGRGIEAADCVRGAAPVAVLSHRLWRSALGGRPDVVGSTISLGGRAVRIVGVAPAGFDVPAGADLWAGTVTTPLSIGHLYEGFLRVRPGIDMAALEPRLNGVLEALGEKYPDQEAGRAFAVRPLLAATVGDLGPILLILFGATGLLMLLAAVNVTNLTLVRTTSRAREMAVRSALGAGRRRIVGQLLLESLFVAISGGIIGVIAAYCALEMLLRHGAGNLPRLAGVTLDPAAVAFATGLVALTGMLVGVVPALRVTGADAATLLNDSGRTVRGSRRSRRLLGLFVIAEIAVAVAIVAGAARLIRSYQHLDAVEPGFTSERRLVLDVLLPPGGIDPDGRARRVAWWDATEARLREAGATSVGAATSLPLAHEWDITTFVDFVSRPDVPPEERPNARMRLVTPDFFAVMGISPVRGRGLLRTDRLGAPVVGVVNETFARRNLGGADPIGERIKGVAGHLEDGRFVEDLVEIVGVVADVKYASLTAPAEPILYLPFAQSFPARASIIVTTADAAPERHARAFESALRRDDPQLPVEATPLPAVVAASIERQRLGMWLMGGFGVAALVLATVGMFGVIAYVVSQRTGEVAVRQALGATRARVFAAVMAEGATAGAAGVLCGLVIAWWTGRVVRQYVFEVSAADPLVLGGSAAAVGLLALAATVLPARRAARLDLARTLRGG